MINIPEFEELEFYYSLNEDAKDEMRISDIVKKSAGNQDKQIQLAQSMSKSIKDVDKAVRRWEAAKKILSDTDPITIVFATRANELGAKISIPTIPSSTSTQTQAKQPFVYDEDSAISISKDLESNVISKLRGYNWGDLYNNKLDKLFTPEQLLLMSIYYNELKNSSSGYFYRYSQHPKFTSAVDSLIRFVHRKKLINGFDMGDAKTNKSNPANFLFKDINAKEEADTSLQILKDSCREAHKNYKAPNSLFQPGESYSSYYQQIKGNRPMEFNDPWSMYFWNHNMIGQMSDGYWENSRKYKDEWRWWITLLPVYNPSKKYRTFDTVPADIQNPKLVQKYAIQSTDEEIALGKIAVLKHKDLLPFIKYGNSSSEIAIENVKTLENAEKIAQKVGVDLDVYLAFLWEPGLTSTQIKRLVSDAHTGILGAMVSP